MKCPVCTGTDLVMSDRQGVEIDYCPNCRGIWLDRGELDKILERAEQYERREYAPREDFRREDYKREKYEHGEYKKRKSWWTEIFD
jgi:Zn-finger nucleic acid-binding protein